jgi:hypothetical protein
MVARTAKPAFKTLDKRVVGTSQAVIFKLTSEFNGKKVLFTMKNDAYKAQCSAIAQVWRPDHLDWSKVVAMVPEDLSMIEGAIYKPNKSGVSESTFLVDLAELQRLTAQILA